MDSLLRNDRTIHIAFHSANVACGTHGCRAKNKDASIIDRSFSSKSETGLFTLTGKVDGPLGDGGRHGFEGRQRSRGYDGQTAVPPGLFFALMNRIET